ncbi:hypothetical protein ES703_10481 [subsurface metagenome]
MEDKKMTRREARELARLEAREAKEAREREKQEAKEAKEQAKLAAQKAKEAKEAKEKAKQGAKEAKEQAKLAAQKAKEAQKEKKAEKAKPAKEKAKKAEKAKPAKEKVEKAAEPSVDAGTYQGAVTLAIVPPIDLGQLDSLKKDLGQVENLHLVLVGGSVEGGSKIIVSAEEPLPLLDILKEMPAVDQVFRKGSEIQVRLKAE